MAGKKADDLNTHPDVLAPKCMFAGTKIYILDIADLVAQGVSQSEILSRHPELTAKDVEFAPMFRFMTTPPKRLVN